MLARVCGSEILSVGDQVALEQLCPKHLRPPCLLEQRHIGVAGLLRYDSLLACESLGGGRARVSFRATSLRLGVCLLWARSALQDGGTLHSGYGRHRFERYLRTHRGLCCNRLV